MAVVARHPCNGDPLLSEEVVNLGFESCQTHKRLPIWTAYTACLASRSVFDSAAASCGSCEGVTRQRYAHTFENGSNPRNIISVNPTRASAQKRKVRILLSCGADDCIGSPRVACIRFRV